jgi:hypothetical protein
MATRRLARTGLDEKIVHGLSARNINTAKARPHTLAMQVLASTLALTQGTLQELLECSTLHVSELLDVSHEAADRVLKCVTWRMRAASMR